MYTVNLKKPVNLKKRIRKPVTRVCLSKTKVNLKKNWGVIMCIIYILIYLFAGICEEIWLQIPKK